MSRDSSNSPPTSSSNTHTSTRRTRSSRSAQSDALSHSQASSSQSTAASAPRRRRVSAPRARQIWPSLNNAVYAGVYDTAASVPAESQHNAPPVNPAVMQDYLNLTWAAGHTHSLAPPPPAPQQQMSLPTAPSTSVLPLSSSPSYSSLPSTSSSSSSSLLPMVSSSSLSSPSAVSESNMNRVSSSVSHMLSSTRGLDWMALRRAMMSYNELMRLLQVPSGLTDEQIDQLGSFPYVGKVDPKRQRLQRKRELAREAKRRKLEQQKDVIEGDGVHEIQKKPEIIDLDQFEEEDQEQKIRQSVRLNNDVVVIDELTQTHNQRQSLIQAEDLEGKNNDVQELNMNSADAVEDDDEVILLRVIRSRAHNRPHSHILQTFAASTPTVASLSATAPSTMSSYHQQNDTANSTSSLAMPNTQSLSDTQPASATQPNSSSSSSSSSSASSGSLPSSSVSSPEESDCCSICLCEYESGQSVTALPCGHMYHANCLRQWLSCKAGCPYCRFDLRNIFPAKFSTVIEEMRSRGDLSVRA